jgi:Flp pilus assembly pilin Flp
LQDTWDSIVSVWRGIWDFVLTIVDMFKGLLQMLKDIWDIVLTALSNLWENLKIIWSTVTEALKTTWDNITKTFSDSWNAIITSLSDTWNGIITTLSTTWNDIVSAFYGAISAIKDLWDNVLSMLQTIFDSLKSIWDVVIKALEKIIDGLKSVWDNLLVSMDAFWKSLETIGKKIWDSFLENIKKSTKIFSDIGTAIFEALKSGLSGIGKYLKEIFNSIDPTNLFEKIFKVDMGGRGTVEKALNIDVPFMSFAKGGLVPGYPMVTGDSKLNDRILALLSPGEAIIPRSLMENTAVKSIIDAVLSGKITPQGYFGGSVKIGGTKIGISDKGVSIGDQVVVPSPLEVIKDVLSPMTGMWDTVKNRVFEMILKMFEANKFHSGGLVPSFANGGEIPSMLAPGEYVINRRSAQTIGYHYLNKLNNGKQEINPNITINVEIETTQPIDDVFFRNTLMPRIKDDIKRRTLNGEFIVSTKGIR